MSSILRMSNVLTSIDLGIKNTADRVSNHFDAQTIINFDKPSRFPMSNSIAALFNKFNYALLNTPSHERTTVTSREIDGETLTFIETGLSGSIRREIPNNTEVNDDDNDDDEIPPLSNWKEGIIELLEQEEIDTYDFKEFVKSRKPKLDPVPEEPRKSVTWCETTQVLRYNKDSLNPVSNLWREHRLRLGVLKPP